MSRWPPDARERLQNAAWELFDENGYEATTVAQIASRAGLNRATFFRHFADKREILFGGEDVIGSAIVKAIQSAPVDASLPERLAGALRSAGAVMTAEQRERAALRRRVAEASLEVQERGLAKNARLAAGISAALREQGIDDMAARMGAEFVLLAFGTALREWLEAEPAKPFMHYATAAFAALQAAAGLFVSCRPAIAETSAHLRNDA